MASCPLCARPIFPRFRRTNSIHQKEGSPHVDRDLNLALGSDFTSTDLLKRWPFAVEVTRVPAGKTNYPFHSHANQFEFYLIISGTATVRDKDGETTAVPGDFFMFGPGEPHQIRNDGTEDLTYYTVADNPLSDHVHYPDSDKWAVRTPKRQLVKGQASADYFEGEE